MKNYFWYKLFVGCSVGLKTHWKSWCHCHQCHAENIMLFLCGSRHIFSSFFVHLFPPIVRITKAENVFSLLYSGLSNWSCLRKNFLLFSFCLTYCAIKIPQNKVQLEVKKIKHIHLHGSCFSWRLMSYLHTFSCQHCTYNTACFKGWNSVLNPVSNFQQF